MALNVIFEVMCGMGRTGTYFAFEQEEMLLDVVTIKKRHVLCFSETLWVLRWQEERNANA